jgi:XRE family transcriptional regulator, fatty acid utilization regulator
MKTETDKVKLIFGLKIKQLRLEKQLSQYDLSQLVGVAHSYINEIEKGKKYPKTDKIMTLARVLGTSYDQIVSLRLDKNLAPIADLLDSNILSNLPLDMFGVTISDFLELMSGAPTKLGAFVNTIIEISRAYGMRVEQFYFSVLRTYQEMHNNYFAELEEAAERCAAHINQLPTASSIEQVLAQEYGYHFETFDETTQPDLISIRSYFRPQKNNTLSINQHLSAEQLTFTLARELGYQFLGLTDRSLVSSVIEAQSFDQVLNNFKASYFAGALLMPQAVLVPQLTHFFGQSQWQPSTFIQMLGQFQVTPEMFMQRVSHITTHFFGISNQFFMRFNNLSGENRFLKVREMRLSDVHRPPSTISEHYCRRWISMEILQELDHVQQQNEWNGSPILRAQIAEFIETKDQYLVIALARNSPPRPNLNSSVSLGFKIDDQLKKVVHFLNDASINQQQVSETCERCAISDCTVRAVPASIYNRYEALEKLKKAVNLALQ